MDPSVLFSYQRENKSSSTSTLTVDGGSNGQIDDNSLQLSQYDDGELSNGEDEALYSEDEQDGHDHLEEDEELPEYACAYCGIHNCQSVVQCSTCKRWFCNGKGTSNSSHIVTHMVLSKHHSVNLHAESDLGDDTLECYTCGSKNAFVLGLISAKTEAVMVMLCRLPCSQKKDPRWETSEWQALIDNREFLPWIVQKPTEEDSFNSRLITNSQISKLEAKWKLNKDATLADVEKNEDDDEPVESIQMRYEDAYAYQRSFGPLVKREADCDKSLTESNSHEHLSVRWSIGLNSKHLVSFEPSSFDGAGAKIAVGGEMVLQYSGLSHAPWECNGHIIRVPSSHHAEFTLELVPNIHNPPPTNLTTDFTAKVVWKGTAYDRMQTALRSFAVNSKSVSGYLYNKLLGIDYDMDVEFDIKLPQKVSIPGFTELNVSQANAIKTVLKRPLSLIQGPPGTGKTVTSATIVYHLTKLHKQEKVLVCAPSNVAVDHLAQKLDALGLNVVRLAAKSREDIESSVEHLALHSLVSKTSKGELQKLIKLKNELGELSAADTKTYIKLLRKKESALLGNADVVCTTCVGAGDGRLAKFKFRAVLVDEVTQASEPECLIPIMHGAKQVILVGDHQQLGPVIMDKKAADAGLKQSLFERLILLNHTPIRLEVQYRMNPCLAEFASNMFYEGDLQNGVTKEQRRIPSSTFPWPVPDTPMMLWVNYGREEISGSGTSYLNRIEAMNCERIITRMFRDGIKPEQIGVITPYEGQRAHIMNYMAMNGTMDKDLYLDVEVASVDAFQGREKDFIILSCVRANEQQSIGFLRDSRRLNVALTRAKYGIIILGNPRTLKVNRLWNQLLIHLREKGCLVEGPLDNLQLSAVPLEAPQKSRPNKDGIAYQQYGFAASTIDGGTSSNDYDTASLVSFVTESDYSFAKGANSIYPGFFNKSTWPTVAASYGTRNSTTEADGDTEDNENVYNPERQINGAYAGKLEKMDDKLQRTFEALNLNIGAF